MLTQRYGNHAIGEDQYIGLEKREIRLENW
jgi:hypothetical protein